MKPLTVVRLAALITITLMFSALQGHGAAAQADIYPSRPVTLITPAAAGNSPDVAARIVFERLSALWNQQAVIMNRPGAGGLIAARAASGATPDGYTLFLGQASTFTVMPIMQEKLTFDLERDFVPVSLILEQPIAIAVTPSLEVTTLAELMARIRQTPGGMLFAASNRGGQSHLTGELFRRRSGLNLTFVHAQGAASSVNDVSTGRIPIMFEAITAIFGAVEAGMMKLLAVASAQRLPNLPDLPTVAETIPGFESKGWLVLMAPAGTPNAIVQQLNADLRTVLTMADIREKLTVLGAYPHSLSPAETQDFIRSEEQLWWPIVREVVAVK